VICDAPAPATLDEASNWAAKFATGLDGDTLKAAVGVDAGGKITPGGTSRISTDVGFAVSKFDPLAVATIDTQLPARPLQVPNTPLVGDGGAVYTTDAVPSPPVTSVRADSVP
jgi:hypothetical protein